VAPLAALRAPPAHVPYTRNGSWPIQRQARVSPVRANGRRGHPIAEIAITEDVR